MEGAAAAIKSYRDLLIWKASMELAVACYAATKPFPSSEIFGLTSQIRRASASVVANIAEGHGREATRSFIQFLCIAQGSLKELETHLILAERVGMLPASSLATLLAQSEEIGRMLRSMIRRLQSQTSA